jgi:hypothetical protein
MYFLLPSIPVYPQLIDFRQERKEFDGSWFYKFIVPDRSGILLASAADIVNFLYLNKSPHSIGSLWFERLVIHPLNSHFWEVLMGWFRVGVYIVREDFF